MPEAGSLASLSARAWITELLGSTPEAETLISHVERLEAELEQLRAKYEAMRLERSKAVDERDDLTVANTRLANRLRDRDAELERLRGIEVERDDYKDRWEILGRVAKKQIDKLDAENQQLRRALDAEMREKISRTANYEHELAQLRAEKKS
jgi:regulator of replication initiation timing